MMPTILIAVLGITTVVLTFKLVRLGKLLSSEDTVESKSIVANNIQFNVSGSLRTYQ